MNVTQRAAVIAAASEPVSKERRALAADLYLAGIESAVPALQAASTAHAAGKTSISPAELLADYPDSSMQARLGAYLTKAAQLAPEAAPQVRLFASALEAVDGLIALSQFHTDATIPLTPSLDEVTAYLATDFDVLDGPLTSLVRAIDPNIHLPDLG